MGLPSNCPACGSGRPDVCQLLGHVYPVAYKATGEQLRVPPFATGVSPERWIITAVICNPADLKAWIAERDKPAPEKPRRRVFDTNPTLL